MRVACLIGTMLIAGSALAQIPSNMPGLSFEKLQQKSDDGGSDETSLELFTIDRKFLSGSQVIGTCESKYDDGKGRILYALNGGPTSGKGACGDDSFEWTAQSSVSGSRIAVSGRGTATIHGNETVEITQQFTVVVANGKCKLEAYNEKTVSRTRYRSLKDPIVLTHSTVMDATTTCGLG